MLSERERMFLDAPRFGVLATVGTGGSPHQTVMWYALDGNEILFNTARERVKPANLARDRRVSLVVHDAYRFVRVSGEARESAAGEEALADILRIAARYVAGADLDGYARRFRTHERVSYRFRIARVYSSADLR